MQKKRIGIDYRTVTVAPYSGIGRQVRALTEALAATEDCEVYLFTDGEDTERTWPIIQPDPPSDRRKIHRPQSRLWYEHYFLPKALARHTIDVFISTSNCGVPTPLKSPVYRVLWVHDFFTFTIKDLYVSLRQRYYYPPYFRLSGKLGLNLADQVITPSEYNVNECRRLFGHLAAKMRVLPNVVPGFISISRGRIREVLPERYWLLVGTTGPRKNIAGFLEAWLSGGPALPDLVLVGDPADFSEAQRLACGTRAVILSGLDDSELAFIYSHADRLWHPSHAEGFGLPPVEAMSLGVPVAVAEGSALDEIVPPGTPRFSPSDGPALQRLMGELAQLPPRTTPDPALIEWAARFGSAAFNARVAELSRTWPVR